MTAFKPCKKLFDCDRSSTGPTVVRELLLVEGDSASKAVARARDRRFQAVLPMQGKPMNAIKASEAAARRNQWYQSLINTLGVGWSMQHPDRLRYDRVLFLFDPDADGIHCGALMLMFFDRYLRPLLDANRVSLIKAPLFEITATGYGDSLHAFSEEHLRTIQEVLEQQQIDHRHHRYRGLASLDETTLREVCLDPNSRTAHLLQHSDAEAAKKIFGRRSTS